MINSRDRRTFLGAEFDHLGVVSRAHSKAISRPVICGCFFGLLQFVMVAFLCASSVRRRTEHDLQHAERIPGMPTTAA